MGGAELPPGTAAPATRRPDLRRPGRLSIIVPCLDEAAVITDLLQDLQALRAGGHEVIVVDGGSRDGTPERARPLVDRVLTAAPGRATQMNAGARIASGTMLWFLHADSRCPPVAGERVVAALQEAGWGRFDVVLDGSHRMLPVVAGLMNLRSRLTGIATGDQGMFMRRAWFERVDGFPAQPLMEDIELSRRLRALGRPACLREQLRTSARRWESRGMLRTIVLMWGLRAAYALGVSAQRLARYYR